MNSTLAPASVKALATIEASSSLRLSTELRIRQHFTYSEVLSAVLVHKLHTRKATPNMRADFSGLDIADRFLFGCGMDYKGYWRNAPGIYAVKGL